MSSELHRGNRSWPASAAPVIGITAWRRELPTYLGENTDLLTLGVEYAARVAAAGAIPVVLSPVSEEQVPALLGRVDGVLLSGGQDLCGRTTGAVETQQPSRSDLERDSWETALLREAIARRMPVLGICRGLQLTNVVLGGSLIADLPQTSAHPAQESPEDFREMRHDVSIANGSELAQLYGTHARRVNSIHHQAINAIADDLAPVAWATDGVIEAAESRVAEWPFWGVQWHPEKLTSDVEVAAEARLFRHFVERAAQFSTHGASTPHTTTESDS